MSRSEIDEKSNHPIRSGWVRVVVLGLFSGIILGFIDLVLGLFLAEMSMNTYVGIFIAFIASSMLLGIVIHIILTLFFRSKKKFAYVYHSIYFISLLFLYGFVFINTKLNGWFNFLTFRAIILNGLFILSLIVYLMLINRIENLKRQFYDKWGFLSISVMTFASIASIHFFLMDWPSPPSNKLKIVGILFLILSVPYLVLPIKILIDALLSKVIHAPFTRKCFAFLLYIVLFISVSAIVKHPDISPYINEHYRPTRDQLMKLDGKPNIIWIVLDTARRDVLSCYDRQRQTTPNIDAFSKEGVLFTNFISTAPWTLPSHASMFTGMYSSMHGSHYSDDEVWGKPLVQENLTTAEILRDIGFNTGAFIANYGGLHQKHQLDQGFNLYYCQTTHFQNSFWGLLLEHTHKMSLIQKIGILKLNFSKLSSEINDRVLPWLDKNKTNPFLLFINYMEPHVGISHLPGRYDSLYGFNWDKWEKYAPTEGDIVEIIHNRKQISPEALQIQLDWVECKLSFMDYHIGLLLDRLKRLELYDNSLIIIASDHGDLYGEHNSYSHSDDLYNELIHVPLIIKYPDKLNRRGASDDYIQTVDLMPEVLSVLGLPIPGNIQGQPINDVNHKIIAELFRCKYRPMAQNYPEKYHRDLKALIATDKYKYIQSSNANSELYDLANDPYERQNIITTSREKASSMDTQLENWSRSIKPILSDEKQSPQMDKALLEKLKALGYIK